MKNRAFRVVSFVIILSSLFLSSSINSLAIEEFPKGEIIGEVVCREDAKQSYALFLPSSYTPARKWPVLYCFDPVARGKVPLEQFKEGAEKYGYIVAGLNNSRNGPFEKSLEALDAVWKDTHQRFAIDDNRIYTTGFSGGARVATMIAILCKGCVAGVIGCGAGFSEGLGPDEKHSFAYFATIGTEDFNYPELKQLEGTLDKKGLTHRIVTFESGHTWASKELCVKALEWMELQAIKRGKREKDESFIGELFDRDVAEARGLEKEGRAYDAYLKYQAIAEDFKGLRETTEFEEGAARLKKTSEVGKALKRERAEVNRQLSIERELLGFTEMLNVASERVRALSELRRRVAEIKKDSERTDDISKRRVARRALGHLFAQFYEFGTITYAKDPALAAANLEVASEMRPTDGRIAFLLARAYSVNGEKRKALAALKKAVENGFTNIAVIENSNELAPLRDEDEYKKILESIKAK